MSETNPMPQLSLAPSAPVPEVEESTAESIQQTASAIEEQAPGLYESTLTDAEKKQFMKNFIKSIEIYPERTSEGRILKKIEIDFPVSYDTEQKNNFLPNGMGVETVCLLAHDRSGDNGVYRKHIVL